WEEWLVAFNLLLFLLVARVLWRNRNVSAAVKENVEAGALLDSGKITEAAVKLEALCRRLPRGLPLHSVIVHNRGIAFLRAGQPDRALSLFAAVLECGAYEKPKSVLSFAYPMLLDAIATTYALTGET